MTFTDLSFVTRSKDGTLDFWAVEPTGDYDQDRRAGKEMAAETARFIKGGGHPMLLFKVMSAIGRQGDCNELCQVATSYLNEISRRTALSA